jgi:hypothetical protein
VYPPSLAAPPYFTPPAVALVAPILDPLLEGFILIHFSEFYRMS